jgi:hypothetical protein
MAALLTLTSHTPDATLTLDYRYAEHNAMRNELLLAGWTLKISKHGNHSRWTTPGGYSTSWMEHDMALRQAHGLLVQGIII